MQEEIRFDASDIGEIITGERAVDLAFDDPIVRERVKAELSKPMCAGYYIITSVRNPPPKE